MRLSEAEKSKRGINRMREDIPELLFETRNDFRAWLQENADTSEGVWLLFGKKKRS